MQKQKVLNKKSINFIDPKTMVYIGRPYSDYSHQDEHFGNPFSPLNVSRNTIKVKSRDEAITNFEKWIRGESFQNVEPKRKKWILEHLGDLEDKDLVCFCSPRACHGDIYIKLLKERK